MGDVELHRSTAARLEVYEKRSPRSAEQVARMRLTMQQLFTATAAADRGLQVSQRVAEQFTVGIEKLRALLSVTDHPLCVGDSIGEMRCPQIDSAQAGM